VNNGDMKKIYRIPIPLIISTKAGENDVIVTFDEQRYNEIIDECEKELAPIRSRRVNHHQ
jgi:hypothetical protein